MNEDEKKRLKVRAWMRVDEQSCLYGLEPSAKSQGALVDSFPTKGPLISPFPGRQRIPHRSLAKGERWEMAIAKTSHPLFLAFGQRPSTNSPLSLLYVELILTLILIADPSPLPFVRLNKAIMNKGFRSVTQ